MNNKLPTTLYSKIIKHQLISLDISEVAYLKLTGYVINRLYTPPNLRRKNYARIVMTNLCNDADKYKVNLHLEIKPYGTMTKTMLIKFYKSLGFKFCNSYEGLMTRKHN